MNNLEELLAQCKRECDALKIPYQKVEWIAYTARKQYSRFGMCSQDRFRPGIFVIQVNKAMQDMPEFQVRNTVMHELLHTCPGCFNHGPEWKHYGDMVNAKYGYNVSRENDWEIPGTEEHYKYRFRCTKCGQEAKRHRASDFTINYRDYRCHLCGGEFVPVTEKPKAKIVQLPVPEQPISMVNEPAARVANTAAVAETVPVSPVPKHEPFKVPDVGQWQQLSLFDLI